MRTSDVVVGSNEIKIMANMNEVPSTTNTDLLLVETSEANSMLRKFQSLLHSSTNQTYQRSCHGVPISREFSDRGSGRN